MKFHVDRGKWLCGDNANVLYSGHGCFCIIGFFCRASCGVPPEAMYHVTHPRDINPEFRKNIPDWLFSTAGADISDANDRDLTDEDRESLIAQLFAKNGVAVEFKGEYP